MRWSAEDHGGKSLDTVQRARAGADPRTCQLPPSSLFRAAGAHLRGRGQRRSSPEEVERAAHEMSCQKSPALRHRSICAESAGRAATQASVSSARLSPATRLLPVEQGEHGASVGLYSDQFVGLRADGQGQVGKLFEFGARALVTAMTVMPASRIFSASRRARSILLNARPRCPDLRGAETRCRSAVALRSQPPARDSLAAADG